MSTSNGGKQQGRPTREAADPRVGERYSFIRRTYHRISGQPLFRSAAVLSCLIFSALPSGATKLSELADSMVEGQWAGLPTNNISAAYVAHGAYGFNSGYSDNLPWDPATQQLFFVGGDHDDAPEFMSYAASTNQWQVLPKPSFLEGRWSYHGYDHGAVDPVGRHYYVRSTGEMSFWRYHMDAATWTKLPDLPGNIMSYNACCTAVAWFPERQSLVYVSIEDGWRGSIVEFHAPTQQWRRIHAEVNLLMGENHQFAEYNPVHKVVFFGGGDGDRSKKIYKLAANGTITALNDAPFGMGTQLTVVTVDPHKGDYLVLAKPNKFFRYTIPTDAWHELPTPSVPVFSPAPYYIHGIQASPISTSGVNLFVTCVGPGGNCYVNLYKHSPGSGTPYVPPPPGSTPPPTPTPQPPPPPAPPSPNADFQARCDAQGVIKCIGFDAPADFNTGAGGIQGAYGQNSGIIPSYGTSDYTRATQDTTTKASGNSSLKFTIPPVSNGDTSGMYFTNFSDDLSLQFGENSEFYVQWRQRFSPEFITTPYAGGGGWKQAIITTGDQPGKIFASCEAIGIVTQQYYYGGFPILYNSCTGSTSHGPYDGLYQGFGTDYKLQNARPAPYCLYSSAYNTPTTYLPPSGNCFGYFPNEWMTFQMRVKTGPRVADEFTNSFIEFWIAREGQPSELVISYGPYKLSAGWLSANERYGKVILLPYNTGKKETTTYPVAYTWYDELIISRHPIADPNGTIPPGASLPPSASVNAGGSLSSVRVFPNPWRSDRHTGGITFDNLPGNSQVKIFTASGQLVKEYKSVSSQVVWDRTNTSGDKAASGVYLYLITAGDGQKKKGKVGVIK